MDAGERVRFDLIREEDFGNAVEFDERFSGHGG
jgi:hypothetical protein